MDASDRLPWLFERQQGIGASDAPNLVGLGYRDALDVYRSKVEPPSEFVPDDGVLARGIALEGIVADRYSRLMDVALVAPPTSIMRSGTTPIMFASPDRLRADNGRPVEIKTVAGFGEDWGPMGSTRIPDGYHLQVQQQMGCLGADSCDLAALDVIGWELRVYRIALDKDLFLDLAQIESEFWHDHVLRRIPPTIEWEAKHDPRKLGLIADRGTRTRLDDEHAGLFAKLADLGQLRDEVEEEYKATREALATLMGRAERADCGPWTVKKVIVGEKEVPAQPAKPPSVKPGYTYLGKPSLRKDKK